MELDELQEEAIYYHLEGLLTEIRDHKASKRSGFMPGPRYGTSLSDIINDPFLMKATKVSLHSLIGLSVL